jgi:formylglycine-generating enzyme required for sulfatase activity
MLNKIRPNVLDANREEGLQSGEVFRECNVDCPEIVVVPGRTFMMGLNPQELKEYPDELPRHPVAIAKPFPVRQVYYNLRRVGRVRQNW